MAHHDTTQNLNRAVCNAAGEAERADQQSVVPVKEDKAMMQAIYLNDYVKVYTFTRTYSSKHKHEQTLLTKILINRTSAKSNHH